MNTNPPPARRPGRRAAIVAAVLAVLTAIGVGYNETIVQREKPAYLATALYGPEAKVPDANLLVYTDGTVKVLPPEFDQTGHAKTPNWRPELGPLPGRAPFVPSMGWGVTFMDPVSRGVRGLRYCNAERRAYDQAHGTNTAGIATDVLRRVFELQFEGVQPAVEDCATPDFVFGANAAQDCGGGAWGCAALLYRLKADKSGYDPYVRITFNGDGVANGSIPLQCVEAIDRHEVGHGGDLAHSGEYGGEGRPHAHRSDMGYVNSQNCRLVDNPTPDPAIEDWLQEDGHSFRYAFRPRGQGPQPTPEPTARPTPTPEPTAPPLPAITKARAMEVVAEVYWRYITERDRATTLDAAVAADLRAGGAADAYWAINDAFSESVGALRQPAPPRRR